MKNKNKKEILAFSNVLSIDLNYVFKFFEIKMLLNGIISFYWFHSFLIIHYSRSTKYISIR